MSYLPARDALQDAMQATADVIVGPDRPAEILRLMEVAGWVLRPATRSADEAIALDALSHAMADAGYADFDPFVQWVLPDIEGVASGLAARGYAVLPLDAIPSVERIAKALDEGYKAASLAYGEAWAANLTTERIAKALRVAFGCAYPRSHGKHESCGVSDERVAAVRDALLAAVAPSVET